ncbi:hypothetical protein E1287_17630 [Actinomadura sp. KC06]|nr:hypothetical protein E1287_17630 [Actinomadura sp. KC06]
MPNDSGPGQQPAHPRSRRPQQYVGTSGYSRAAQPDDPIDPRGVTEIDLRQSRSALLDHRLGQQPSDPGEPRRAATRPRRRPRPQRPAPRRPRSGRHEATADGRLGVAQSIRGRVRDLGGTDTGRTLRGAIATRQISLGDEIAVDYTRGGTQPLWFTPHRRPGQSSTTLAVRHPP